MILLLGAWAIVATALAQWYWLQAQRAYWWIDEIIAELETPTSESSS